MSTNKCRVCLKDESLVNIFQTTGPSKVASGLMLISKVDISPNDGLPNKICTLCIEKLEICIEFIKLCESTDYKLRNLIDDYEVDTTVIDDNELSIKSCSVRIINTLKSKKSNKQRRNQKEPKKLCSNIEKEDTVVEENSKITKLAEKQQCFTCGKIMSSKFRLKTHLRTHTGERPYSCPHCGKNFSLAQNLKVHLRTHTGEKPLQCSVCGESFAQSAGLAAHRRKHTGQTPYRCVLCPRSFRTVGHLQYHVRRHTGEKNFECETCGKAFITRSDLKQHFLTHTGDRPHVCCVCGARMTRASHLKRHMQHAHGQYSCTQCAVKFKHKHEYDEHVKTHESVP